MTRSGSLTDYLIHIRGVRFADVLAHIEHAEHKLPLSEGHRHLVALFDVV